MSNMFQFLLCIASCNKNGIVFCMNTFLYGLN